MKHVGSPACCHATMVNPDAASIIALSARLSRMVVSGSNSVAITGAKLASRADRKLATMQVMLPTELTTMSAAMPGAAAALQ